MFITGDEEDTSDESNEGDNEDGTEAAGAAVTDNNGAFSTSIFGEFTDLIIFALLGVILCCLLVCCFLFCIIRKRKKQQMKKEEAIAMASIGKTVNVNEGGEGQAATADTEPTNKPIWTNHQVQQTMTPDSTTAKDPNVTSSGSPMGHAGNFMFNTNAQFNMMAMGYPHQQNPYGVANNLMRLNSLSSTGYDDGASYGYGTGVVPASPPNYPHSVHAMMANNGVQQPSPMSLNNGGSTPTPQHPQQQYSSSQHGQQLMGATPNGGNEMADDQYEYYEDEDGADDQLEELFQEEDDEEDEHEEMYAANKRNMSTPGGAGLQQQSSELEQNEDEYYDEDEYYEDEPYGGM